MCDVTTIQRQMLAYSHDGRLLAVADGYQAHGPCAVKLWNAGNGELYRTLENPGSQVNAVAFSPNDSRIAVACEDRTIKLWDTATGQNVFVRLGHTKSVTAIAFSPDGQRLASGSADATVRIWDAPEVSGHRLATGNGAMPSESLTQP